MEMIPVVSSLLKAVGFDDEKEELHIEFHKGDTYLYQEVPRPVFEALIDAHSAGHFFLVNVKNQYEYVKVA
jgi:hypothetical protein